MKFNLKELFNAISNIMNSSDLEFRSSLLNFHALFKYFVMHDFPFYYSSILSAIDILRYLFMRSH